MVPLRPRDSPLRDAPIDVQEQMSTALLCMNRKLEEQALSRIVASFHKDLLADDVMARLETIHVKVFTVIKATSVCHEIFHYMRYYKSNGAVLDKSCRVFHTLAVRSGCRECLALIVEQVGDILLSHVVSHPDQDHEDYFLILGYTLLRCNGAWLDNYIDQVLDAPTIRNRFSSLMPCVQTPLLVIMLERPASRHSSFVQDVFHDIRRIRRARPV